MIPMLFYQSWDDDLPSEIMNINKIHMGNFEYLLFNIQDMQNYLKNKWGVNILYLFNKYKKICHKVDLWRYCILYDTGGVYMDADCILTNSIERNDFLNKEAVFVTNDRGVRDIFNGFIMTVPKNPIIKKIIDYMVTVGTTLEHDYYFNCKELYNIVSKYLKTYNLNRHSDYKNIIILVDKELTNGMFYPFYKEVPILLEHTPLYPYTKKKGFHHVWIGSSKTNEKIISIPFNGEFYLNENEHPDTFEISQTNGYLRVKRTDFHSGWGYPHSGYIKWHNLK